MLTRLLERTKITPIFPKLPLPVRSKCRKFRPMLLLTLLLASFLTAWSQTLSPIIEPRATGMGGAMVALSATPSGVLYNPASLFDMSSMGSDMSFGTQTGTTTDRVLISYANPASEDGARVGTGIYVDGQFQPGPWKYYAPYIASLWSPLPRLAVGANVRIIHEIPRADSLDDKWSNAVDLGFLTAGENLNFGARVERAFGGTSVVPKTIQWGIAMKSDKGKMNVSYQWDGDLLNGIKYSYEASRLGAEYVLGNYGLIRGGYIWSDVHRISGGAAVGLIDGGSLLQVGFSFPTEGKAPTEWSLGLSYRL